MTRRGFLALAASVRDDSIGRLLERELPAPTEYLLFSGAAGSVISARWEHQATAAPLGSLVKPFVALAYGEAHDFRYPDLACTGCWLPQGHGRIGISVAIAHSCNSYFLQLARLAAVEDVERTATRYGLPLPVDTSPESLIGRFGKWRATPLATTLAYNELALRRAERGVAMVLDAMRQCASNGTARALGARVAAKTGTAPCVHSSGAPGDGLLIAMLPEFVMLARAHAVPGAECARRAGAFVRAVVR